MKRPYFNEEERLLLETDTLSGAVLRLDKFFKIYERSVYKKYWIFGWFVINWDIKKMLKPINKQMKANWFKSNGRYV